MHIRYYDYTVYILSGITIFLSLLNIAFCTCSLTFNKKEKSLRKEAVWTARKLSTIQERTWNLIQDKTQIPEDYKPAFSEIYQELMGENHGEVEDTLRRWIMVSNPDFNVSQYENLSQELESLRTWYQSNQEQMTEIVRKHSKLCKNKFSRIHLKNKEPIDYSIIENYKKYSIMIRSKYKVGEFLYGIPGEDESAIYHPEGQRVFIHDGYICGDGYGKLVGWNDGKIKKSTGHGNFCWGGEVRKASDEEIEEFMSALMSQETVKNY